MTAFQFGPSKFQKQFASNPFPHIPKFLSDTFITITSKSILKASY